MDELKPEQGAANSPDTPETQLATEAAHTAQAQVVEVVAKEKKAVSPAMKKKRKKWIKRGLIFLVLGLLVYFVLIKPVGNVAKQISGAMYTEAMVEKRDITVVVTGTGTVKPAEAYNVTSLAAGNILEAPFEEGDAINKGDLLFKVDTSDLANNVERAELALTRAKNSYNDIIKNQKDMTIYATGSGVVQILHVKVGDTVSPGTPIADILDSSVMQLKIPFNSTDASAITIGQYATVTHTDSGQQLSGVVREVSASDQVGAGGSLVRFIKIDVDNPGAITDKTTATAVINGAACSAGGTFTYKTQKTVTSKGGGDIDTLSIKEGDTVRDGGVIATISGGSYDSQKESARLSITDAELSLQSAKKQLENYTITSPISGTVIEKNAKVGDKLDGKTAGTNLAVLYDLSYLTFEIKADELDIGKIKVGQAVNITAEALPGKSFTGTVDRISINGITANGITSYPVSVLINDPQDLLPGMNISADIIIENAQDVVAVPVAALARGNKVLVMTDSTKDKNGVIDPTKLEEREVTIGRSDFSHIEIVDGLKEGEKIAIKQEAVNPFDMMMGPGGGQSTSVTIAP